MTEPKRLRDSAGPAGVLMGGANALRVPSAARRRALVFTGTAASLAASTSVAAHAPRPSSLPVLIDSASGCDAGAGLRAAPRPTRLFAKSHERPGQIFMAKPRSVKGKDGEAGLTHLTLNASITHRAPA